MRRRKKWISPEVIGYAIIICIYFWMAKQVPYTHDDWTWGLEEGMEQLVTASVNSRYVGNLFVVVMTRSQLAKVLVMGVCHFLLPYLLADLVMWKNTENDNRKRFYYFLAACGFCFLIDHKIWQQTFGWVSGYANFVVSALFLLACYKKWLCVLDMHIHQCRDSLPKSLFWGVLCFVSQLFIENITVVITVAAFWCCVYCYGKNRKVPLTYICMLIGALAGMLLMFSNPIYSELQETGLAVSGHREMTVIDNLSLLENLERLFFQCASLAWLGFDGNVVLNIIILAVLSGLVICHKKYVKKEEMIMALSVNAALCTYYILAYSGSEFLDSHAKLKWAIAFFVGLSFYIAVIIEVLICTKKNHSKRVELLLAWGWAFVVILPLVVVKLSGPRMLFTYYIFAVLFALILVDWLMEFIPGGYRKIISVGCVVVLIVTTLLYVEAYAANGRCVKEREKIVAEAIENDYTAIVLPRYPHTRFLWGPYPNSPKLQSDFKKFCGLEESVEINLGPYPKKNIYWQWMK